MNQNRRSRSILTAGDEYQEHSTRRFPALRFVRTLGLCFFLFAFAGCNLSAQKIEFEKAESSYEAKNHKAALAHYDAVVRRYVKTDMALKAAEQAGRIAFYDLKAFDKAIAYFKHIVLYSPDAKKRFEAQKLIAEINFSHLQNYKQAIIEYHRLLDLPHDKSDGLRYRFAVAKSYFYLNNFFQALIEANDIIERRYDPKLLFDTLELKANILLQTKRYDEAIEILKLLIEKYPQEAKERQIGLVLTVCYEEKKDFAKAIETLVSIKDSYPSKEFIESRIKSLRERQSYLPGAKGWRK